MIICKICNKQVSGNGFCGEHSTGMTNYPVFSENLKRVYDVIIHLKDIGAWKKLTDYYFEKYKINEEQVTDNFIDDFIKINKL
jgi:hypothetical protein